ncbi:putative calcium-binding protein [Teratosphaeria destructans]|uniref:Calcium-binding protein n=1 Tax=Teratosphaeria destructans TaxID=418781 RepID=A0A9W7SNA4_9PEZI|nr:putative calcium-binding protein [Teratosphaeria destructans]
MILRTLTVLTGLVALAIAHGSHEQQAIDPNANWATKHMAEEHHITSFDDASFFNLHDYDSSNEWTAEDLLKTYGLKDSSTSHISQADKNAAVARVIKIFDRDLSGTISFAEYTVGTAQGLELPDLGYGPGHHGDDEYEYEIHHFEKYHGDGEVKEEDLNHPEDIEHFRKHEEMELAQERQEKMDQLAIIEQNIPAKFRRVG